MKPKAPTTIAEINVIEMVGLCLLRYWWSFCKTTTKMKATLFILAISVLTLTAKTDRDCTNAFIAADDAYSYCKKAYGSDSWEDTKSYLKKAMSSFDDVMSYAEIDDCQCEEAHSAADYGYSYAKKGYNSTDWEETKDYARKAKSSADDAMSYANDCND